ncbi:MAG: hypothetical protein EDM79_19495, partial [Chloroflexi bacterium]
MTQKNEPDEIKPAWQKSRLNNPLWRLISAVIAVSAVGVFLYIIVAGYTTIPIMTVVFFLMLLLLPQIWRWIEFVFSKRPSNVWWRLALDLVLAILMASLFEDVWEIVV